MKKKLKIILIIIVLFIFSILSIYVFPFKRKYVTQFGCKIDVPLLSKVGEKKSRYATLDEQTKLVINSYQSKNSVEVIYNFIKNFKFYKNEYGEYYYNELDDYTIIIENIDKKDNPKIELTVIKGDFYTRRYEDDVYLNKYSLNHVGNVFITSGNEEFVNAYKNIYTYNLKTFWISYRPYGYDYNYHYTIEDTFKYNYHTIDEFLNYYENLVSINYGKKTEEDNYTLYTPVDRIDGSIRYSILVCNDKYIFGDKNLKYNENLCK